MTPELADRLEAIEFRANDSVKIVVAALREAVKALEDIVHCESIHENFDLAIRTLATIETLLKK